MNFADEDLKINELFLVFDDNDLWKILNEIKNDSNVFLSFYNDEEDKNNKEITLSIANSLKNHVNFYLLYKFYKNKIYVNQNEIINLIKDLNYLDSIYLKTVLVNMKQTFPHLKVPYTDLEKMYEDIIICDANNYLANDCLELFSLTKTNKKIDNEEYLYTATKYGAINCVKYLKKFIKLKNNDISTNCMYIASENNHLELVRYFSNYGSRFENSLLVACKKGYLNIVEELYTKNNTDYAKYQSFVEACNNDHINIINFFIENKLPINYEFYISFSDACENNKIEIVKIFIKYGVNVNGDGLSQHPINKACEKENLEIVKILLNNNAAISDETVLDAITCGNLEIVKLLFERNRLFLYVDFSIMCGRLEILKYIVEEQHVKLTIDELILAKQFKNKQIIKYIKSKSIFYRIFF